ncbi:S8 family serine peptidase [Streptomyces sp. NPDC055092]
MSRPPARRGARLLATAGLSLALLPAGAASALSTSASGPAPTRAAHAAHTVTLITGDKVTVTDLGSGQKTVAVERPDDATGAVHTQTSGGRITVVPDEAQPYLQAGELDPRLFDVTALIKQGLDDRSADGLPLIVTYTKGSRAATPRGTERVRDLPSVRGAAVEAGRSGRFWHAIAPGAASQAESGAASPGARSATSGTARFGDGVAKIWLDGRVNAEMADSNAQIGTPEAWQAGLTGKGVKVAVLDTGVDATHPDLKDRIGETKSFIDGQEVADRNGHGTHVTSTVGGSGAGSDGKERGVAPDATLAVGKVLSDQGSGSESQIIAGMEWAAKDVKARIVSMSLGSAQGTDGTDPMSQAVDTLSKDTGALFVIAAGNSGAAGTIGAPGAADAALTVGAVDSADKAASFTSKGPRAGDNALKPDLSAPGVNILAARSQLVSGSGLYTTKSGTSMATPHVAGAAALLAQKHPDWTGAQLKDALMSTSKQLDASAYALGAGRVDVPSTIAAQITATGSADLGFYSWPYDADKPVTKTLTYTNSSDQPIELNLSAQGTPVGTVTLADSTLTVPAHGSAQTIVTGDGSGAPVGTTSGQIVAKSGDTVVAHTAFGLVKEDERYTLTVHVKDRDGAPVAARLGMQKLAKGASPFPAAVDASGTVKLRLQPGTYSIDSFLDVRGSHGKDSLGLGFLSDPDVTLDRDREVTLDGRTLREVRADVDRRTETRQLVMKFNRAANGASYTDSVQVPLKYDSVFAAPTKRPADGIFEYRTVWRLGKPRLDTEADGTRLRETVAQPGSALFTGRRTLRVVDAGAGGTADYAGKDMRGNAVVVHRTDATTPAQLAQNAQDAGAKALFVTDDTPGRLMASFAAADGSARPLSIATVDTADAARLLAAARHNEPIQLTGTEYTPYVYDLTDAHPGAIPAADLTYRPGSGQLAELNTRFHAPKAADGSEFRYLISDTFPIGTGLREKVRFPAERTDYVSTGAGDRWHETVTNGPDAIEERSGLVTYMGGSHTKLDWFKPVWHPWLGTGLGWGQQRRGNSIQFNTPGWGDSGPDHTGLGDVWGQHSLTQVTALYANGTLLNRLTGPGVTYPNADPGEHTYKVVTDTTLDPDVWGLASKGHSEWTFKSARTPDDQWTYLPLLNLGFDVETDLHGDVRAGQRLDIGLSAEYVKGAASTGTIGGGSLEVSYDDGETWTAVHLDPSSGGSASWKGALRVPDGAHSLSLRASASDDRGSSVRQEVVRAVGVTK